MNPGSAQPPDPFTEIREWLAARRMTLRADGRVVIPASMLAELIEHGERLEREAAERETAPAAKALADLDPPDGWVGRDKERGWKDAYIARLRETLNAEKRAEAAEARVREVEAERDRLAGCSNLKHFLAMRTRAEAAEATVARQVGALREIADADWRSRSFVWAQQRACAVLASPEAAAAEPREPDPWPIIEWLAGNMPQALELCPYKVGGETVSREAREYVPPTIIRTQGDLAARRMWEATEQAKRERAAALPAVDAPPHTLPSESFKANPPSNRVDQITEGNLSDAAAPPPEQFAQVHKATLGRALMLLDRFPRWSQETNMEYAAHGTAAWMAEAKNVLDALVDAPPEPTT